MQDSGTYTIVSDVLGNLTVTFQADNGSTPVISTGAIGAGGTNSTIIPGVTLTAKAVLVAGTDTITISANSEGVARSFHDLVEGYTRVGGFLEIKNDQMQSRLDDINDHRSTASRRGFRRGKTSWCGSSRRWSRRSRGYRASSRR